MNDEPTVEQLKKSLDIIEIAGLYGELVKSGTNYKYKDDNSIVISPSKQIFSDFNGNITGGSVYDLVKIRESLTDHETINRLKELNGLDTYTINPALQIQRKEEEKKVIDFQQLGLFAKNNIKAGLDFKGFIPLYHVKKNENEPLTFTEYTLRDGFIKLFETNSIPAIYQAKVTYLINHLLGYDNFWKCPSIIIKDDTGKVVDYIAYRPVKPDNFENWTNPKYIYKNSHNRGADFLYPFRKEVESILSKQTSDNYLIVGEGIKNGLNALLYSVPFITLESTSNKMDEKLISYIKSYDDKGYKIIAMFDGDEAGLNAFTKFKEQTGLDVNNFLDFSSGLDFVDYLQSEDK